MRVVLPDSSQSLLGGGKLFNFCFGVDGQHAPRQSGADALQELTQLGDFTMKYFKILSALVDFFLPGLQNGPGQGALLGGKLSLVTI